MPDLPVLLMYPPSDSHRQALLKAAPQAALHVATSEPHAARLAAQAEVILGNRYFLQSLPYAQRLRWMQSNSMGMDRILRGADHAGLSQRLRSITLTCARGIYDDEMADHALALLLAVARGLHWSRDAQHERRWPRWSLPHLHGRQALILGWGGIGQAIATRLRPFSVTVHAARRTHSGPPSLNADGVWLHGPRTWRDALPRTTLLLICLPLTDATHHLVGSDELAAMPSDAIVVNVGRGPTLDQTALLAAIRAERLYGAGLDVLETEPPPDNDPIWQAERVLVSPHVARSLEQPPYRWEPLFVENLRRYAHGEPLLNVVDQEAGY